jgi:hypothetical protein
VQLGLAPIDREFVAAHPLNIRRAMAVATEERCDFVLRSAIPTDRVIVMDPTEMSLIPDSWDCRWA